MKTIVHRNNKRRTKKRKSTSNIGVGRRNDDDRGFQRIDGKIAKGFERERFPSVMFSSLII